MYSSRLSSIKLRLNALLQRRRLDRDLDDELAFHLAQREEQLRAVDPSSVAADLRSAARRRFGNTTLLKEECRAMWTFPSLDSFWQDVRFAARMLRKSPAFTAVAVLTLALGIGANTAIFSVVDAVLFKRLPYNDPDRLVLLDEYQQHAGRYSVSWMNFLDWRASAHTFEDLAACRMADFTLTGAGEPALLRAGQVSAPFFRLLGVNPARGRAFTTEEDRPGAAPAAILGYEFWRDTFHSDPAVLGRNLTLDGVSYTVVGILPADFSYFPRPIDLYLPIGLFSNDPDWQPRGNHPGITVLGRLRRGVTLQAARAEMDALMARLESQYPESNSGERSSVVPLYEYRFGSFRTPLYLLFAAVLCVLLVACANVANLQLARAAVREREFALRAAIGAGRRRLLRQLLTENILLSLLGGAAGLSFAYATLRPLLRIAPSNIPRLAETHLDARVFALTLFLSVLSGTLFGLVPALQSSRSAETGALKESGRGGGSGRRHRRIQSILLVSEVALALSLVISSGLLLRSLANAQQVNPGFRPDHVLALDLMLPDAAYPAAHQRRTLYAHLADRLRDIPGAVSASIVLCPPLVGDCWDSVYFLGDRPIPPRTELPRSVFNAADPDYFRAMGTPLVEGRFFTAEDAEPAPLVAIVNQTFARLWWPGQSAIGKRIKQGFPEWETPYAEIVGVVADLKQDSPDAPAKPEVFYPLSRAGTNAVTLVIRATGDPKSMEKPAKAVIHSLDPALPVSAVRPLTASLEQSLARRRFATLLLGSFAILALALAAAGTYGVMAYAVEQQTREIGIRMALGEQQGTILGRILGDGLRSASAGVLLGLAASLGVTRSMQGLLFGITPTDPATFLLLSLALLAVAAAACYLPARRAMRVDPVVALRQE